MMKVAIPTQDISPELEEKRRKAREASKKYYASEKGKEARRKYMRKYTSTEQGKKKNQDKVKRWRKLGNRKPEKRTCSKEYREAILDFLLKRDGTICGMCGVSLLESKLCIDHIIPYALGGENKLENYRAVHEKCNIMGGLNVRKQVHGY